MNTRAKYSLSEISGDIGKFRRLIASSAFEEALIFWKQHLDEPTLFGAETCLARAELLSQFFPDGLAGKLPLKSKKDQAFVYSSLALTLNITGGYPNRSIPLYEKVRQIAEELKDLSILSTSLGHHAKALRQTGRFREAAAIALRGLEVIRGRGEHLKEAVNLYWLGMGLAHRGEANDSETALQRSLRIFSAKAARQSEGAVNAFLAQRALWLGLNEEALVSANKAISIGRALEEDDGHADLHGALKVLVAGLRMKGEAMVKLGEPAEGRRFLSSALKQARAIEFIEEELPALRCLATDAKNQRQFALSHEYLKQTWDLAERGDFRVYNADSHNTLARLEMEQKNIIQAVKAARKAFELSWCDGPPYTYHLGSSEASAILAELAAAPPNLAQFDDSLYEPLINIEINPPDEFSA